MDWIGLDLTLPITDPTWIFLLVLLIILFAPILLNKLRIPHIIGMILAGLAIGEHGFNILARDSSFELFGKVGLYYIMFLAGLEMNMGDFKETRNKALVLGLLAFIVPIGIGFVANVSYLKYGVITSVLLASMYASHTLVAYRHTLWRITPSQRKYRSRRNCSDGHTHTVGSRRCRRTIQRGDRGAVLDLAGNKSHLSRYVYHLRFSTCRALVLPSV